MSDTPKLDMPEIAESQSSKYLTHNEALRILDAVVQCTVIDKDLIVPPASPSDGDTYIVGMGTDSTSGDWEDHDDEIAYYKSSAWVFFTPIEGWRAYVQPDIQQATDGNLYIYEPSKATSGGSGWIIDISDGVRETVNDVDLKCALISIGDWDMDTDATKYVYSAAADFDKIRAVQVFIRNDSDAAVAGIYPLGQWDDSGTPAGKFNMVDNTTNVRYGLSRVTGGIFDGTDFNETSYNRGWIMVWYEA